MTVDVLVDAEMHPWQRTVAELLGASRDIRTHEVSGGERRRRSLAVAFYARVDRWASPARSKDADIPSLADVLGTARVVVDLTERQVSLGLRTPATILMPRPSHLDEAALLEQLVAHESTLDVEIVDGQEESLAASTIQLVRLSARRSSSRVAHRVAALLERALAGQGGGERSERDSLVASRGVSSVAVARLLVNAAAAAVRVATTRPSWRVAVGTASGDELGALPETWRAIQAPPGHWYADPFLARDDRRTYLFVEDFDVQLGRASIAAMDLESSETTTVLSANHHLSYPYVFEVDGGWFMVPETAAAGEVVLYRCDAFPYVWSRDSVLLDSVVAFDSTLLRHDGLWWLFAASGTPGAGEDDELHVWFSEKLHGPFTAHPLNPVRSSVVGSRPAGRIVEQDGRLIRPAQDGSREYGGALVLQQIDRLTTTEYAEHTTGRIDASDVGARGIHTVDRVGDVIVVDTKHAVAKLRRR